ncbi:hypothetical protein N7449_011321 [Penicillium cf. viridicatum]|uniref:Uncharacterized protein n=1 Tax=Penicillium cf. viridicatum TaxID=2972119 RepID=A0A9W9IYP7_9EURO|nr:hypothetical protein N7449_011321 [Penicillium cf. viridicatum]
MHSSMCLPTSKQEVGELVYVRFALETLRTSLDSQRCRCGPRQKLLHEVEMRPFDEEQFGSYRTLAEERALAWAVKVTLPA